MKTIMAFIPDDFADKARCRIPMCWATLPNGNRYDPMTLLAIIGNGNAYFTKQQRTAALSLRVSRTTSSLCSTAIWSAVPI